MFTYSNFDGIETSLYARLVAAVEEKVAGTTVHKSTYSRAGATINGQPAVVETQAEYSSATQWQTTITTTYHHSASEFLAGRVASVTYPDGKKDTYSYEKGNYVTNADPSLNQFTPDVNGLGERTTLVHGTTGAPEGVALKTTKETTINNQLGKQVLQESYVYTGADYERVAWAVMSYDDRGHLTQTIRSNGQVTTSTWVGNVKASDIDESGVETAFTYDSLGRVKTRTKKGVAANGTLAEQADITTTLNYDAEGRGISTTVTGGSLNLTTSNTYDAAGRTKTVTDQAGLVTVFAYSNGGRTQTTTLPGGATRVSEKYLDGQPKYVAGTAVVPQYYGYGVGADGAQYTQEFVGSAGLASPRWTKTTVDWLKRTVKVEKPSFTGAILSRISTYNASGQLQAESTKAGANKILADTLYEYDELGNLIRTGLDADANGTLAPYSNDRIKETDVVYEKNGDSWFSVFNSRTYLVSNDNTQTVQTQRERLSNFPTNGTEKVVSEVTMTDVAGGTAKTTRTVDRAAKKVTVTTDTPDSNVDGVSVTYNGLLVSSSITTPQSPTTYSYDALGRTVGITDPRAGTTTRSYSPTTGQLISLGDAVQTTAYDYYSATQTNAGRLKTQTNANGKKVYFNYDSRGETIQTWGDTGYPMEYVYDSYGQRSELHTFRAGSGWGASVWPAATAGAADVTRWAYNEPTGLVTQKQDAATKQVGYTYDELSRPSTRTWSRTNTSGNAISTTYGYDPKTGELTTIDYSDTTPDIAYAYDRGGRQSRITDAAGTHTQTYNAVSAPLTEQITGGILDGVQVSVGYDGFLRRSSLQTSRNAATLSNQSYTYDASSRLGTITSGTQTATYAYYPTSGLLNTTTFTGGTSIARSYDALGQLQSIATSTPASGTVSSYAYTYNNLHQRTKVTREDGSYWSYNYNDRGELILGRKYWSDGTPVWGQQTEYAFDNIGNRSTAKTGGNVSGSLRQSNYSTNSLNQYVQRSVPGAADVMGTANTAATVTVNDQATDRKGDYFYKELAVGNSAAPVSAQVNVVGAKNSFGAGGEDAVTQQGGRVFVPQAAESYTYDADGNLTQDGRWQYAWDAENRLVSMQALAGVPAEAKLRLEFAYDCMSRRIQKKVYGWNVSTGVYQLTSTTRFVYDGWDVVAELDGSNTLVRTYVWGQDASGTLQGAGGIGGLLLIGDGGNTYQAGYDGSGNLTVLVKAGAGTVSATYDYDPFGQPLKSVGEYAARNTARFSTKYTDTETGLVYYGYRYYAPQTGRWLSRDVIGENGGSLLYNFLENNSINRLDYLGQFDVTKVAGVMNALGWSVAEKLQRQWFDGLFDAAGKPKPWPNPDTTTVTMDWILNFERAKEVFDEIGSNQIYQNGAALKEVKKLALRYQYRKISFTFGDLGAVKTFPQLHQEHVNHRSVDNPWSPDELQGALGRFNFYVLVYGCASYDNDSGGPLWVKIQSYGVYANDPYDFNDPEGENQYLGYWREDPAAVSATGLGWGYKKLSNRDYRDYRKNHNVGRDYEIFSDVKIVNLKESEQRGILIY